MANRKRNRLKYYDYSQAEWYFVTMCTKNHINHFGEIKDGKMQLNNLGEIVDEYWREIDLLHENVELDYYVIRPNHIHGIIIINVGDENLSSQSKKKGNQKIRNATFQSKNAKFAFPTDRTKMVLSKIIQQFKRAVTIRVKSVNQNSTFKWQRSFYERIIRNERELFEIRKYIQQNPLKWNLEKGIDNLDL